MDLRNCSKCLKVKFIPPDMALCQGGQPWEAEKLASLVKIPSYCPLLPENKKKSVFK